MSLQDDVKQVLRDAGTQIKADLWKPEDDAFLAARAKDIVGLNAKALAATDPAKKKGYQAAAKDVVNHVRLLAVIRMEAGAQHIADILGQFFMEKVLPALIKLVPVLLGL